MKKIIATENAPKAIGTYSQAVSVSNSNNATTVYLSGQIPLIPETMQLAQGFSEQTHQVFKNLRAVCQASGGEMSDIVKLNIYVVDLNNFATLNEIMAEYFVEPYPARAAVQVSALPKGAEVEIEGTMVLFN